MNIVEKLNTILADHNGRWKGSASDLIELGIQSASPKRLTRDINAHTNELIASGIDIKVGKSNGKRFINIVKREVHDPVKVHDPVSYSTTSVELHDPEDNTPGRLTDSGINYQSQNGGESLKEHELIPVPEDLTTTEILCAPEPIKNRWRCPERCAELFHGFCALLGERKEAVYSQCPNYGVPVQGPRVSPVWAIQVAIENKKKLDLAANFF